MNQYFVKILKLFVVTSLIFSLAVIPATVKGNSYTPSNNTSLVDATFGDPQTLDPIIDYDSASAYVIQQMYETLLTYNREKTTEFVPILADSWIISPDNRTYTFHIRSGVHFHNGDLMTPEDVASSFWRDVLIGGPSSAQWMLTESLLGSGMQDPTLLIDPNYGLYGDRTALKAANPAKLVAACNTVKAAVTYDNTSMNVVFHLPQAWSPFLAELAGPWSSIMDMTWVAAKGEWSGDCNTWQNFYAITAAEDPFTALENGTGPYVLDHWTPNVEVGLVKNSSYWLSTPLWNGGPSGTPSIQSVTIKNVAKETDRVSMLLNGSADLAYITRSDYASMDSNVLRRHDSAGISTTISSPNGSLEAYDGAPSISADDFFFNYNINNASPYIGTGTLGTGIPVNFFSDIHVRKAFNYAFNWDQFITQAFQGNGIQRTGPVIKGDSGYADAQPHYSYDTTQAMNEFNLALGGTVAANGFTMTLVYNTGNNNRMIACQILKAGIEALSPKFHVNLVALPWPTVLSDYQKSLLPMYIVGWLQDIPDPYNWLEPYLTGTYGSNMHLPQDLATKYTTKISNCLALTGDPARVCYEDIQTSTYSDAIGIYLAQATSTIYVRSEVRGYFYNPGFWGPMFYTLSKGPAPTVSTVTAVSPATIAFNDSLGSSGSISMPAGSVSQDTQVVVTPGEPTTGQPTGFLLGNFSFSIQGYNNNGTTPVTLSFTSPVQITITYNDASKGPLLDSSLKLFTWNGSNWVDAACGPYVRDTTNHMIIVPVCHFSDFALGGSPSNILFIPVIMK